MRDKNDNYYAGKLNSHALYQVYDTSIPRIKQYLNEEIRFIQKRLHGTERVLEVGAGYGRILKELSPYAGSLTGIDISGESVAFGRAYLKGTANIRLEVMDAHRLNFGEEFDIVLYLQNALSAINGEPADAIKESMKALRSGGSAYFSTYSSKFWTQRLKWFEEQADKGLIGEIDMELTKDGSIVCKDGFRAKTLTEEDFTALGKSSGCAYEISEVDDSSLFLILTKP